MFHARAQGSNFDKVFFLNLMRGELGDQKHFMRAIIGPPAERHLNGVSLACRYWPNIECWLGNSVIFQGFRTSFSKNPYIIVIFLRGLSRPPAPFWMRPCVFFRPVISCMHQDKLTLSKGEYMYDQKHDSHIP